MRSIGRSSLDESRRSFPPKVPVLTKLCPTKPPAESTNGMIISRGCRFNDESILRYSDVTTEYTEVPKIFYSRLIQKHDLEAARFLGDLTPWFEENAIDAITCFGEDHTVIETPPNII